MKRILLIIFILILSLPVLANEMEEDYLDIASNYCVLGDYGSAISYLDKILEINKGNTRIQGLKYGLSGIIYRTHQNHASSITQGMQESMRFKRDGDIKSEYASLVNAINYNHSYMDYYNIGNFFVEVGERQKALQAFDKAIEAKTNFAPAYLSKALVLFDEKNYLAALPMIEKYVLLNSNDDLGYAIKARIEFELEMYDKAKISNNQAIKLNNCPEYQFDRGKILYKTGAYSLAKNTFEGIVKDVQTSKIYEYMAMCDMAMQDYSKAFVNIDKALLLSINDKSLESKYNEIKYKLENK